jgi:hypothetical protein
MSINYGKLMDELRNVLTHSGSVDNLRGALERAVDALDLLLYERPEPEFGNKLDTLIYLGKYS